GDRLEGGSSSIHPPRDHAEVEQPHVKPTTGSPDPSVAGARGAAAESPGAVVCPWGAPGPPAGKGALLRQEAIASQEDVRVPPGKESPAKALEKGSSHPEPLGPGGHRGTKRVPPRSRSVEAAPGAAGRAGSVVGREAEVCPGETQADPSVKIEICPWEESEGGRRGPGRAPGEGGSEGDPLCPGEEPGMEKPAAKPPELPKAALEKAESRRAEVCPWESGEGATVRAEICPWDTVPGEGSGQRGSPSPGEGAEQPGMGLAAKHPALPKTSSKQAGTIASKKANVCPWEVEDEPLPKTEICPWEEPAAPSGKERPGEDTRGMSKGENKPGHGGLE
ncbi:GP179 protein, partial [Nyctibius bracteatus]|nr:GP179 protein [Nyctibius bracteatus]NXF42381.1 GP179 protein [Nyctibius bracteatus]